MGDQLDLDDLLGTAAVRSPRPARPGRGGRRGGPSPVRPGARGPAGRGDALPGTDPNVNGTAANGPTANGPTANGPTANGTAGNGSPDGGRRPGAEEIADLLGRPRPTPEQVAVIEAPAEPLLVVAGAGAGKTETMAARVVWLVANGLVDPASVLGLTFTRKAAGELGERIRARLRALHRAGAIADPAPVTVSTYHAYAATLLADHGLRIGVEPGARLIGEAAAWQIVDDLVERWPEPMPGLEAARATVVEAVVALAGECADHLVDPDRVGAVLGDLAERLAGLPAAVGDPAPGKPSAPVAEVIRRLAARGHLVPLVRAYRERKAELGLLDFADQVALAARIVSETPGVVEAERDRYRVVLLDEYQDTSHAQELLLRTLFGDGHQVTAVGDPFQSIYGWRGASSGTLTRFRRVFGAGGAPTAVRHLSTSWRNDRAVLDVAQALAAPLRGTADVEPLRPRPGAGPGRVEVHWHATLEDEARAVAEVIDGAWHAQRGARPTAAVLCRARRQFPLLEAALRARGLPVEVVGLGGLLHVPEVADLRAALEAVHDPTRGDALMRLVTGPAVCLGPRDLDVLGAWGTHLARQAPARPADRAGGRAPSVERSLVEALDRLPPPDWADAEGRALSPAGRDRLGRLAAVLAGLRGRAGLSLVDLVAETEHALLLGVEVAARPGMSPSAARAHLDAFLDVVAGFAESRGAGSPGVAGSATRSLGSFLAWLDVAADRERGLDAGATEPNPDAVQIATVHAAKGLEWDLVAVAGLVEGSFPEGTGGREVPVSKGWLFPYEALPYPLRGDAEELPALEAAGLTSQPQATQALAAFYEACGRHDLDEERRLAYVAITRARAHLVLTGAVWGDGSRPRGPSRFLLEARACGAATEVVWQGEPEDGAENPREARTARVAWPVDPLGEHRPAVEAGAALVRDAAATPSAPGAWDDEIDLLLAERDRAGLVAATVELPGHLSVSRVVRLADDPVALAAHLRRPLPSRPNRAARRGSAFHAWLEQRFSSAALVDVEELPGAMDDDLAADADLDALRARFLAGEWADRTPAAVEVAVETPVAGLTVRGRIDAVFHTRTPEGDRWEVVDWKTAEPRDPEVARVRAVQLAVYRLAWARLQGVPVESVDAAFFYAATGRTVRPVGLLDEQGLEELVIRAAGPPSAS